MFRNVKVLIFCRVCRYIFFYPCCAQVGDGTTSVTLLAAEFLKQLKPYVEEGLHPQTIIRAFRTATNLAVNKIKEISVSVKKDDKQYVTVLL